MPGTRVPGSGNKVRLAHGLTSHTPHDMIIPTISELIQSSGGNGPMKLRQPLKHREGANSGRPPAR